MTTTEMTALLKGIENIDQLMEELRIAQDEQALDAILRRYDLPITLEDMAGVSFDSDELDEEDLFAVAGGCSCKGPLKRVVNNFFNWVCKKITGKKTEVCPDCG